MASLSSTMEVLFMNGLINRTDKVKILANGEIKDKIEFQGKWRQ